ncbi:MAG: hypothetical protein O2782_23025 [bacterium]|nr:hypothetical protein [bacterium]
MTDKNVDHTHHLTGEQRMIVAARRLFLLLMLLASSTAAASVVTNPVEGFARLIAASNSGDRPTDRSLDIRSPSSWAFGQDRSQTVTWETAPVAADAAQDPVTFVWSAGLSGEVGQHELEVDGQRVLTFSSGPFTEPQQWQEGDIELNVSAMHLDHEDHVWFATWGGGACCHDPTGIHIIDTGQGPISCLTQDAAGRIWAGFGAIEGADASHVTRWDGSTLATVGPQEGLSAIDCMALHQHSDGTLWLGDWNGLIRCDGQRFHRVDAEPGGPLARVYSLAEDEAGVLYIGHGDARNLRLSCYARGSLTQLLELPREGLQYISAICKRADGAIWFGLGGLGGQGPGRGVGRYAEVDGLSFYGVAEGLPDNCVEDLCDDGKGNLWIATTGGLSRFDGTELHNFSIQEGLPSNFVQCLFLDSLGHLWIGSESGISRWHDDSFQSIHCEYIGSVQQIVQDSHGTLWLGTPGGLVGYAPQHVLSA